MRSRTLIIDDDPVMRLFIAQTLSKRGHEVLVAGNGSEGIELMRNERPGLVLCDVQMEGVNGFNALEILRNDPLTATVPFILMTGTPEPSGMRRGMSLGADDFLTKPFSVPELIAAVEAQEKKRSLLQKQEERRLKDLRTSLSLALPHEFFTPLNAIMGYAELMNSMAAAITPGEIEEMTQTILRSGERLHRLIKSYLTYAQFEMFSGDPSKVAALRNERCEGAEQVIWTTARNCASTAGRERDLGCELEPVAVRMKPEHLTLVTEALVENAFKFSENGKAVGIEGAKNGPFYELTIIDQGRGMSAEQIAHAGAFLQFDRDKHEQQGIGLGLAIARRIVELHGGALQIQSSPSGTNVQVKLAVA